MKTYKLFTLIAVIAGVLSCENNNKELDDRIANFRKQSDSISNIHDAFQARNDSMMQVHKQHTAKLEGIKLEDSTVFEKMARHEALLKRHQSTLASHKKMIDGHRDLRSNFEGKSDKEISTQLDEMEKDHKTMESDHSRLKSEHNSMKSEHEEIMKKIDSTGTSQNEMKD